MKKCGNNKKLKKRIKRNRITSVALVLILAVGMVAGNLLAYAQSDVQTNTELNCNLKVHTHDDSCYEDGELICGLADFVVHEHDSNCYDKQGKLICALPEIKEHTHDDNCYSENRVLICGKEETPSKHEHTDECFTETKTLVCTDENHQHDDSCYEVQRVLTCEQDEKQPEHVHTDECFKIEKQLVCDKKEVILHEHDDSCYDSDGKLVCGKLQVLRHQHDASEVISNQTSKRAKAVSLMATNNKYTHIAQKAGINRYAEEIRVFPIDGGSFKTGQVAYCYNKTKAYPGLYDDYEDVFGNTEIKTNDQSAKYWEIENASAAVFSDLAGENRKTGMSDEEFRSKVISVAANGYPADNLKIKDTYNFSDTKLNFITQVAIWYYTDHNYIYDDLSIQGQLRSSGCFEESELKDGIKAVNSLINSDLEVSESQTSGINLFETDKANGANKDFQPLLSVNSKKIEAKKINEPKGIKAQIVAQKTLGGEVPEKGQFTFVLKDSSGKEIDRTTNDENGKITFTKYYEKAGTYKYTIEEVDDGQAGIVYDTTPKEVTVTITSQDVETYDEGITYYGQSYLDDDTYNFYYYIDSDAGDTGIRMFCTYHGAIGPQYASYASPSTQTYRAIINPTLAEVINEGLVRENQYGDQLLTKLKKLFYYLKTKDADKFEDSDNKQKLVWFATGIDPEDPPSWNITNTTINGVRVKVGANGVTRTNIATKILDAIYDTVDLPENYNIVFFQPTGQQLKAGRTQPLATGYGANISYTANGVTFQNTIKEGETFLSITAKKTVDGNKPQNNQKFNFELWKDGKCIATAQSDENGDIVFPKRAYEAGQYIIKEVGTYEGIVNDPNSERTVEVKYTSDEIESIENSATLIGGGTDASEDLYIQTADNKKIKAYCIWYGYDNPRGSYSKIINPSESDINSALAGKGNFDINRFSGEKIELLKKLLYFFETHDYKTKIYGTSNRFSTINYNARKALIWYATGEKDTQGGIPLKESSYLGDGTLTYGEAIAYIKKVSEPPEGYTLLLFNPSTNGVQPVIAGLSPDKKVVKSTDENVSVVTFNNTTESAETHALTVSKTVTGNSGDKEKSFEFEIVLRNEDGTPLSGNFSDVTFDADGKATINLAHGESKTIEGLPEGYKYTITEKNADDYTTKINGAEDPDKLIEGDRITQDVTIAFENNKDIPLTGLSNHHIPFIVTTIIGICGAAYMMYRKKRRKN